MTKNTQHDTNKKMYMAGGCFWGLEHLLRSQTGVVDTHVGYTGGQGDSPTYEDHPGHAETVEVTYDPTKTTRESLWDYFFRIHDPTTKNRQGNDIGSSYRSTIFYQSEQEKLAAASFIRKVNESGLYAGDAQTSLEPFTVFYPAEDYHQDYLAKNPRGYTCHFERSGQPITSIGDPE